jgi:hypothetical protein
MRAECRETVAEVLSAGDHSAPADRIVRSLRRAEEISVTTHDIHVDEELLDEYLLGRADAFVSRAVAQHVAECGECRLRWVGLRELRAALEVVAAQG